MTNNYTELETTLQSKILEFNLNVGHIKPLLNPLNQKLVNPPKQHNLPVLFKSSIIIESFLEAKKAFKQSKRPLFVFLKRNTKAASQFLIDQKYSVCCEWIAGMLTNFIQIQKNLVEYNILFEKDNSGQKLLVAERQRLKTLEKVFVNFHLTELPDLIIFSDAVFSRKCALLETITLNIPTIAICDSNANPKNILYPIFANDDSVLGTEFLLKTLIEEESQE